MATRSTASINSSLVKYKQDFTDFVVHIYSGTRPQSADDGPIGTLLAIVTKDGLPFVHGAPANGLNFGAPVLKQMSKEQLDVWKYTGLAVGTARWARLVANAVDDNSSDNTVLHRSDFDIGKREGQLNLIDANILVGKVGLVQSFVVEFEG